MRCTDARLPVLVFSDVDGVLRNPCAAPIARAAKTFAALSREDVVVVLCSGKTRAEIELAQKELGLRQPFIAEAGAAAFIPRGYFPFDVPYARDVAGYRAVEFGRPYADIVAALHGAAGRFQLDIVGFSDLTVDDVARECGLPLLRARLAKLREYVEPCRLIDGSPAVRSRFMKALQAARLRAVTRGAHEHVGSIAGHAVAVHFLRTLFRRAYGPAVAIGLADGAADDSLLPGMDYRVIVQDDGTAAGAVDVRQWAETIGDMVRDIRQRAASQPLCTTANHRANLWS